MTSGGETKVLVVDDLEEIRWLLCRILSQAGYQPLEASTEEEALEMVSREAPGAVLLDLKMPGPGGMEVLRQIKARGKDIQVIIITAYGEVRSAVEAIKLGAYDYLAKPFDSEEVLITLKSALQERNIKNGLRPLNARISNQIGVKINASKTRIMKLEYKLAETNARLEKEKPSKASLDSEKFGAVVASIRHDLRNSLTAITNAAAILRLKLQDDDELCSWLKMIKDSALYCDLVIENLLDLVGKTITGREQLDVHNLIDNVLSIYRCKLPKDVTINKIYSKKPLKILANAGQIQRAFMNIVENAVQAMPKGGTLTIRTSLLPSKDISNKKMISISFSDTGIGIPKKNIGRIFDLSFTTKKTGYGLGLYIVKQVIDRHGGKIDVTSEVNKGTTLTLSLPVEREANVS